MDKYDKMYNSEVNLLKKIVLRHKKQFKGHKVMNNLVMLNNILLKNKNIFENKKIFLKSIELCKNVYVLCSREVVSGFFLHFNMLVMGIVSRIHFLLKKFEKNHLKNKI
ncbi:hypothetical protein EHP00_800 [Ecytonucleospora hepatopenaei]|uniref:Nucleolus and neural progenitor protein-like N-terminal domain-containing protein n=1 Tax=Ecytonucleospora hepatopenaei TaxID=646526 RepID=A0A1W0E7X8_9MICR|nr:hypothetical protein EHP00_800 [Ecytonucleospora hepatopenaei]